MAFSELEPFGYEQEMLGSAIVASTVANRLRVENEEAQTISDFMPKLKHETEEQDIDHQISIIEMANIGAGGKDLRKHK